MQSLSIAAARSQLPKIINAAEQGDATQLTRRGKPVAVLLSLKEYEALTTHNKNGLLQALKTYQSMIHEEDEPLPDEEVDSWRSKESGRPHQLCSAIVL